LSSRNKKVVIAPSTAQRFEHFDILPETFTSLLYVLRLNLYAEYEKSNTTTFGEPLSTSLILLFWGVVKNNLVFPMNSNEKE